MKIKDLLPKSILPRLLIIFFFPLFLTQILAIYFFYEKHWEKITTRFSNIAGNQIALIIKEYRINGENNAIKIANDLNIKLSFKDIKDFPMFETEKLIPEKIIKTLNSRLNQTTKIISGQKVIDIFVFTEKRVLKFVFPKKYLESETPTIFFLWIIISSLILSTLAFLFLRIQVRAIVRLSKYSNNISLGKFKPEGATEIRLAGNSIIRMKKRIKNEIETKIKFLAGISHDLGTLITRIKLQIELVKDINDVKKIKNDVKLIQNLLNEYLIYSKNEASTERKIKINVFDILYDIVSQTKRQYVNKDIKLFCKKNINISLEENKLIRVFSNLLNNACQFSKKVKISVINTKKNFTINVEDNGPGIPNNLKKEVFKPFFKKDIARNLKYSGSGLGLSITKEIVKKIGGKIYIKDSKLGGACFVVIWPK